MLKPWSLIPFTEESGKQEINSGSWTGKQGICMELWRKNIFILTLTMFVIFVARTFVNPYLPLFVRELGVVVPEQAAFWAGLIASSGFLGQSLSAPIWGLFADRYGRKAMILRALLAMTISMMLISFVNNVYQLLAIRFLLGCFSGFNAAAIAFIATETPENRLGYAMGLFQTGQMAGMLLGPGMGGAIIHCLGYRLSFAVAGYLALAMFFAVWLGIKETKRRSPLVPNQQNESSSRNNLVDGLKLIASKRIFLALFVVLIAMQFTVKCLEPQLAVYSDYLYRGDRLELIVAAIIMAPAILHLILAPALGRFVDRGYHYQTLLVCLFGAAIITVSQAYVSTVWHLIFFRLIFGGFMAGIIPVANALIGMSCSFHQRGFVFGLTATATALGNFTGPLIGGIIIGLAGIEVGFKIVFFASSLLMIFGALLVTSSR